jgi:hypothetical protein
VLPGRLGRPWPSSPIRALAIYAVIAAVSVAATSAVWSFFLHQSVAPIRPPGNFVTLLPSGAMVPLVWGCNESGPRQTAVEFQVTGDVTLRGSLSSTSSLATPPLIAAYIMSPSQCAQWYTRSADAGPAPPIQFAYTSANPHAGTIISLNSTQNQTTGVTGVTALGPGTWLLVLILTSPKVCVTCTPLTATATSTVVVYYS